MGIETILEVGAPQEQAMLYAEVIVKLKIEPSYESGSTI
jgi:hypothetical protein